MTNLRLVGANEPAPASVPRPAGDGPLPPVRHWPQEIRASLVDLLAWPFTTAEKMVLVVVYDCMKRGRYSPPLETIAGRAGLTASEALRIIRVLESDGHLRVETNTRGISVYGLSPELRGVR